VKQHHWRAPLIFGFLTIILGMTFSFLYPIVRGSFGWGIPIDIWLFHDAAQYIGNGALGFVYESSRAHHALVLWPILLAPAAALGQHFELTSHPVAYPRMWLLIGPLGLATSTLLFYAAQRLTRQVSARGKDLWTMLALLVLVVGDPALFGHYEDILAVAFVMLAVITLLEGRTSFAGFLIGLAIGFKQWAFLGVPILIAATPKGSRLRALAFAGLVPGFLFLFPLLVDWEHASRTLLRPTVRSKFGHPFPWISRDATVLVGPYRLISIPLAILIGVMSRDRRDPRYLLAAFGLVFAMRLLAEPVAHPYYLAPALAFFVLHERLLTGRVMRTVAFGVPLLLIFVWYPNLWLWWILLLLGLALTAAPAARDVFYPGGSARSLTSSKVFSSSSG
jgi:hypothetical protein